MSKIWYDNLTAVSYFNNMGTLNLKLAMILSTEYGLFMPKTNSGLQQHIYQEQLISRQISNLEHQMMLQRGNSILLFFTKLLKNLEKQTYLSLLLELISSWIYMCLGIRKPEAMAINAFSLTWNNSDFYMFHLSVLQVEYY